MNEIGLCYLDRHSVPTETKALFPAFQVIVVKTRAFTGRPEFHIRVNLRHSERLS
jgi:hypothetical protein